MESDTPSDPTAERSAESPVDWASVEDALDIVGNTKANLLIIGPEAQVMDVVRWAIAQVPASIIVSASEAGRLRLRHLSLPGSILVLRDIDELDPEGQASLFEWLDTARGDQQIVCTASPLLLSMVNTGAFDSRLFYRLNTVCIRLAGS
jgi:hypothetical protein